MITGEHNESSPALHRERQAYVYGWKALQLIGADKLITREQWIYQCADDHRMFLEDQEAAQDEPRKFFRGVWRA